MSDQHRQSIPSSLEKLLVDSDFNQEKAFYHYSQFVKSNDAKQVTHAIDDLSSLTKGKQQWSKYLKSGMTNLRSLLTVKKDLLMISTSSGRTTPSISKHRASNTKLTRQIHNSTRRLLSRRHKRPTYNGYSQSSNTELKISLLEQKIKLLNLSTIDENKLTKLIKSIVCRTIKNCGEFVCSSEQSLVDNSKMNRYIQQLVENTLILKVFYRGYCNNQMVDTDLLDKIRKELCAVLALEDFMGLSAKVSNRYNRIELLAPEDSKPRLRQMGIFSELNRQLHDILQRLKFIVDKVNTLHSKPCPQYQQCQQSKLLFLKRKHELSNQMNNSLQDCLPHYYHTKHSSIHRKNKQQPIKLRLSHIVKNIKDQENQPTFHRQKLLCTISTAVRQTDLRIVDIASARFNNKTIQQDKLNRFCEFSTLIH